MSWAMDDGQSFRQPECLEQLQNLFSFDGFSFNSEHAPFLVNSTMYYGKAYLLSM